MNRLITKMITQELSISGLSIACKTWGNPANPPIMAIHGWLDNANSFDPIAQYLQNNFYLIAIDLPGHGHSSHLPMSSHYHFTDGIFYIIQILNALKFDQVHLLGHSMGACLASIVGGVDPERFLSLSLIEGLGPFSRTEKTACKQLSSYLNYITQKKIKKSKGYNKFESAALARAIKGYVSLDIAKILCQRALVEKHGQFYWRHDQRLLGPSPLYMTEIQILSCLQQIRAKTCLIWASKGFSFDSNLIQERVKAIKNLRIEHLDGGHHVHMEQPEVVGELLADFYRTF
jgi:pimeloyl-ACP methyl ester carboxylesterase